jgi:AmiR/NasT family two-component response regulator
MLRSHAMSANRRIAQVAEALVTAEQLMGKA